MNSLLNQRFLTLSSFRYITQKNLSIDIFSCGFKGRYKSLLENVARNNSHNRIWTESLKEPNGRFWISWNEFLNFVAWRSWVTVKLPALKNIDQTSIKLSEKFWWKCKICASWEKESKMHKGGSTGKEYCSLNWALEGRNHDNSQDSLHSTPPFRHQRQSSHQ